MGTKAVGRDPNLPHVEWVDLDDNGVAVEVIVVKRDRASGDLYFIRTDHLDEIDRKRIVQVLRKRDAAKYELWDLLSNTTLANGVNALEFFHQLVRVKTQSGQTLVPSSGRVGIVLRPEETDKRGPGRPRKEG